MRIKISKKYVNNDLISFISLTNKNDFEVVFCNFGASIYAIYSKNKFGNKENIIMTPKHLEDFLDIESYYGKIIGRTSGRISDKSFYIDDEKYELINNKDSDVVLHGGESKLSNMYYDYEIYEEREKTNIIFKGYSKDGDAGYPGSIELKVTYTVYEEVDDVLIDYYATTNKKTVLNLTNHAYFNLSGDFKRKVLEHNLMIKASRFVDLDNDLLPICIRNVNDVMDFRETKRVGLDIEDDSLQDHNAKGYDHPWIFDDQNYEICNASLSDPLSGRQVDVYTTYPVMVVYSNNYPSDKEMNDKETLDSKYDAICLECQFIPNGINMDTDEDKAILDVNQEYHQMTRYSFKVKENKYYE